MNSSYLLLADLVLLLHTLIVAFIVFGLILIVIGGLRAWQWVANPWFRVSHLIGIAIVVAQAWLGRLCPLTILENWLRREGGSSYSQQSFMQYWLERILYYDLPLWVFAIAYSLFAMLVIGAWLRYPPRFR